MHSGDDYALVLRAEERPMAARHVGHKNTGMAPGNAPPYQRPHQSGRPGAPAGGLAFRRRHR